MHEVITKGPQQITKVLHTPFLCTAHVGSNMYMYDECHVLKEVGTDAQQYTSDGICKGRVHVYVHILYTTIRPLNNLRRILLYTSVGVTWVVN